MKNKLEFKWAFVFFLTSMAWMLIEKLLGWHSSQIENHALLSNFFAIFAVAIYVFALIDIRKNKFNDSMTWNQGFKAGAAITAIVTVLSPLSQIATYYLISPEYYTNMIDLSVSKEIMTLDEAKVQFSLRNQIHFNIIGTLIMGLITSAIVAIFTKK